MVADDKPDDVLGVSMVSSNAGEVIHEAAMGLRFYAQIQDLIDSFTSIWDHGSGGALKIAATSRDRDAAKRPIARNDLAQ